LQQVSRLVGKNLILSVRRSSILTFPKIFNDEVDSYKPWTLFLIFISISVLISGVVLLTHKKPERAPPATATAHLSSLPPRKKGKVSKSGRLSPIHDEDEDGENQSLRSREEGVQDPHTLFHVGDTSDDEDEGRPTATSQKQVGLPAVAGRSRPLGRDEVQRLMDNSQEEADDSRGGRRTSESSDATISRPEDPFRDDPDEFGDWESGSRTNK
jgi:hypothetical protein